MTSHEILEILRLAPLLEYVGIHRAVYDPRYVAIKPLLVEVTLSCLRNSTMTHQDNPTSISRVLQHIHFPPDTFINLTLFNSNEDHTDILLEAVSFACRGLKEDSIQYLSVAGSKYSLFITGWIASASGTPCQSICINYVVGTSDISSVHRAAAACLPFGGVHSLWVAGKLCVGKAAYLALPRLKRVWSPWFMCLDDGRTAEKQF